jgi:putative FmdB family regulatory protein
MPTYEYACTSCGHEWEFEQSIKDAPLSNCTSCGNATARRQISRGTGFILKGGGWYSDLYGSSSNKPPSNPEKSDKASGNNGASKSTEAGSSTAESTGAKSTSSKDTTSTSTPAAA